MRPAVRFPSLSTILAGALVLGACGDDGGDEPGADAAVGADAAADAAADPGHECVPYAAETTSGTIAGMWEEQNDSGLHSFSVPAEPGGGMVEVTLSGAPVGPHVIVELEGLQANIAASGAMMEETEVGVTFEVAGGQSLSVEAAIARNAAADDYPVPYTISWTYTGREDCYEPNDTEEQAKLIPAGEELTAFFGNNRVENYHIGDTHDDWYRFELDEAAEVTFELLSIPTDLAIGLHGFNDSDAQTIGASVGQPAGQAHAMDLGLLDPGVYYVHVEVAGAGGGSASEGEATPDHFQTPYTFRLDAQ